MWCVMKRTFEKNPKTFKAKLTEKVEKNNHYKNVCEVVIPEAEVPAHESVILVTYHADGRPRHVFGYAHRLLFVRKSNPKPGLRDVQFHFYTKEKLEAPLSSSLYIQKLCAARVGIKMYDALVSACPSALKQVTVNPSAHAHKICRIELMRDMLTSQTLEPYVNRVHSSAREEGHLVALVNMPDGDSKVLLLSLVHRFLDERPVVVCAKNMLSMHVIANLLALADTTFSVLAVKESEVRVKPDLVHLTLRKKAGGREESRVLLDSKIILTVLSDLYISDCQNFAPGTVCIIDDANLQVEAATALAVKLAPAYLVLLGSYAFYEPSMEPRLTELGYQRTLFHRLWEAADASHLPLPAKTNQMNGSSM